MSRRYGVARRWGWNSLRLRLLLAILAWVVVGIGGIWVSATRLFAKHVELGFHEELEVHVQELAGLIRLKADGAPVLTRPLSDPRYLVPMSGFYWQVNVDGHPPLRSLSMRRGALDEQVAHSAQVLHRIDKGPSGPAITYGFVAKGPQGQDVHYMIATDERLLDATISDFTRDLTGWLGGLALTLLLIGGAVVLFAFEPLDRLAAAIGRLRQGDREALRGAMPLEIAPLADDLNAYIAHTAGVVERARVEAGNLAHSLRTPLAVIIDEAERLAREPGTQESAQVLLDQAQRMAQQIELRLARARAAVTGNLPGAICRIAPTLAPILSAMRRLHPGIAFVESAPVPADASLPIDPSDLTELLSIVLDNAGKWARTRVDVGVAAGRITIADDGPGMTGEERCRAGEAGLRFDPDRPGSGLGLAIARDIVAAYALDLTLSDRQDGQLGLCVTVAAAEEPR
ncbi:sensor histidine kinase [Novosphingobium piscinae]|uniref:histidine kinase n=1 Tax=Novosphingobium piscinae TaxID=1507448 RepID=A0A7X1FYQ6_9SPHN|nr:HAMP domain-containing sensor histidine kinase [Novosphingobium piscinae]MBC2668857.1 HAMP domain-containing histidine kinase [Novosphingobium piscinae]